MNLDERFTTNAACKKELADCVADFVEDNDIIMMNAGTTLIYVLRAIQDKKNITIVTNSIQNALEAMSFPSFNVILLGGQLDPKYQYTHGLDTLKQLDKYHAPEIDFLQLKQDHFHSYQHPNLHILHVDFAWQPF